MTTIERCTSCGGLVDLDDLFCSNCGREVPDGQKSGTLEVGSRAHNFGCKNCGASMLYDATALALKCPFCGSVDMEEDSTRSILSPDLVVPFLIGQPEAENRLRAWLGSSVWYPGDLQTSAQLTELKSVYVPFWIFEATIESNWTADTNRVPFGANASWFPVAGYHEAHYSDIWVPASEGLSVRELSAVSPFDSRDSVAPDAIDFKTSTVEQFSVSRKYARPLAQAQLELMEAASVGTEIGGSIRNARVNILMKDVTSRAALVPIFVMAYRYRDKLYRFVLNGQTGQATGTAPKSIPKIVGSLLVALVLIAVAVALLIR